MSLFVLIDVANNYIVNHVLSEGNFVKKSRMFNPDII